MPRKPRKRLKYSPGHFPTTRIGPRGCSVTARERDGAGKAYLHWTENDKPRKRSLEINLYNAHGQLDPEAQRAVNAEQQRVLGCLLAGENPYPDGAYRSERSSGKAATITVDEAFRLYRSPYGPVQDVSRAQQRRYRQVHERILTQFGSKKLVRDMTLADLEEYARRRCSEIARSNRKNAERGHPPGGDRGELYRARPQLAQNQQGDERGADYQRGRVEGEAT